MSGELLIVTVDSTPGQRRLSGMPAKVYDNVLRATQRLAISLQSYIKTDKLSGQVLHVRTGTLRRSINQRVDQTRDQIRGRVGTNVIYAPPHEYGFTGPVNVKAHTRKISQAWGRPIAPRDVLVQNYTRQVDLPERSFIRSALADMSAEITEELTDAVRKGVSE